MKVNEHKFKIDLPILTLLLMLMSVGLFVLYSAGGKDLVISQSIRMGVGWFLFFVILLVPNVLIRFVTPAIYILTVVLLILVEFAGENINGSQRWLNLGGIRFQPSELAKLAVPLMLAYFVNFRHANIRWKDLAVVLIIILIPTYLVFRQPDLGTAALVALSGGVLIFLTGVSWKLIITTTLLLLSVIPFFWNNLMSEYQKTRVMTFLNPESDPTGAGYNIIQSKIAIGTGGFDGKGYMQSVQSKEFLPEYKTDFIFALFSEEFGFWGAALLFLLYFSLIARAFWLCIKMTDVFSRLLASSLVFIFFAYFFLNVAMVSGIFPVVGLPLPFISYGGTSLISLMIAFGLLISFYNTRKQSQIHEL